MVLFLGFGHTHIKTHSVSHRVKFLIYYYEIVWVLLSSQQINDNGEHRLECHAEWWNFAWNFTISTCYCIRQMRIMYIIWIRNNLTQKEEEEEEMVSVHFFSMIQNNSSTT